MVCFQSGKPFKLNISHNFIFSTISISHYLNVYNLLIYFTRELHFIATQEFKVKLELIKKFI